MTSRYKQVSIYLTPEQQEIAQALCPQGVSHLIRDCLDLMIADQAADPDPALPISVRARLMTYQAEMTARRDHDRDRQQLKLALYEHLTDHLMPVILARKGRRLARRAARDMIPAFREAGHILPEHLVTPWISEYLDRIEYSGEVDRAWALVQAGMISGGLK
jgi:hypothetical protein